MKLRSGRSVCSEVNCLAPSTKTVRNAKLDVVKKSCIIKQRNTSLCDTSDSSSESPSSGSSGETWRVSPKPTGRKRSKVVSLKKCNIRSVSAPRRRSTRQACTEQPQVENETVMALGNNLKSLSISVTENTSPVKNSPEVKLGNKGLKHRSKLLKQSLRENCAGLPHEQTNDLPSCASDDLVITERDHHLQNVAVAANISHENFSLDTKPANESSKQSPDSPCEIKVGEVSEKVTHFRQEHTAENIQNKASIPKSVSKCQQYIPKHKKKPLDTSVAGTVKCATSVKTLVTKTPSGSSCKVIPVICIDSSSSSDEECCNIISSSVIVDIKPSVVDLCMKNNTTTTGTDPRELDENVAAKRSEIVLESEKTDKRDVVPRAAVSIPEIQKDCKLENKSSSALNDKSVGETGNNRISRVKYPSKSPVESNDLGGGQQAKVYNSVKNDRRDHVQHVKKKVNNSKAKKVQPLLSPYQLSKARREANQTTFQSAPYSPVNYHNTSQASYEYYRNKSAWEAALCNRGNSWSQYNRSGAYYFDSQESLPASTAESYARKMSQLKCDYDRLGDAMYQSRQATLPSNYHTQQAHLSTAQVRQATLPSNYDTQQAHLSTAQVRQATLPSNYDTQQAHLSTAQVRQATLPSNYHTQQAHLSTAQVGQAMLPSNYHMQQVHLSTAQVGAANQRFDTQTGMKNPVNVFGGNVYLPSSQPIRKRGLRPIIIDGSNVAMGHGGNAHFSYRGLQICVDYFVKRGHKVIAFLPQHRKCGLGAKDRLILQQLEKSGHVVFTPSRRVDNRLVVPYDDWYIVQCAAVMEGVIVSNDNYRDLLSEDAQVARAIKERLLMYTWVDNLLMFPKDPLGRNGPTLDQFLSFPAS